MAATSHSRILILDFGSQVTQLIARRLREAHVYCEIHPNDVDDAFVRGFGAKGVILSGSHASVYDEDAGRVPAAVWTLGVPVLGICYGMQAMAHELGGKVEPGHVREFGYAELRARGHSALFRGIQDRGNAEGHGMLDVWMSHGDKVTDLPPGFRLIGSSDACAIAAMADESRRYYAVQFHPEVTHTKQGKAILARFAHEICGCGEDWNMHDYVDEAVASVRAKVGGDEVILGLSGGVDSSVAAALIHRAIGDKLTCVFVDHGLLRLNEAVQVMDTFARNLGVRVIHVDASDEFLSALAGVDDPELKRKVIGRLFVDVFQREAAKLPRAKWLAQGTIYPDVPLASRVARSSSMKIASARRSSSAYSRFTSPRIRTPSPGPGNGWRNTISRGSPSSRPSSRTSSLNSSRSGSSSERCSVSGRPPTLWCDLIVCAFFVFAPALSMTSG